MPLEAEIIFWGRNFWNKSECCFSPGTFFWKPENISEERFVEYGIDACRLAMLSVPSNVVPCDELLESSFKWLSSFYEAFTGLRKNLETWVSDCWLTAARASYDHLLTRDRPYASFSVIRKAFIQMPIVKSTPTEGKLLSLLLLIPFAPILGASLLNEISGGLNFSKLNFTIDSLISTFSPLQPFCITTKNGGRKWEIFDCQDISEYPKIEISKLEWVKKSLKNVEWNLSKTENGWMICPLEKNLISKGS
ncbi:MAG: hypothetical protein HQM08_20170 [Candidatus Riflebacteria bacterium]|nr:hypothetical protein [Candidatus Riflebacteria bacterium]